MLFVSLRADAAELGLPPAPRQQGEPTHHRRDHVHPDAAPLRAGARPPPLRGGSGPREEAAPPAERPVSLPEHVSRGEGGGRVEARHPALQRARVPAGAHGHLLRAGPAAGAHGPAGARAEGVRGGGDRTRQALPRLPGTGLHL